MQNIQRLILLETMGANSGFACKANFSSHLAFGENLKQ
jgi:hypothetical protein